MAVDHSRWGAKIGTRVAMLVSQSMIFTHSRLASLKHKIAMSVFHAISDEISDEVDVTLGPLIKAMHDAIDETHPAYQSIHFMHTNRGQLKAIAGSSLQASSLLSSIATVMNNELAPVVYAFVQSNPHQLPQVGDVSSMHATGLVTDSEASDVIAANGFNGGWAEKFMDLAYAYPSSDMGLEMLRRGLISDDDMTTILQRGGLPAQYWGQVLELRNSPVSVADAALAVLRGNLSKKDGAVIAAQNGYDLASFNTILDNTGEPPGIMQLLEARRRGFIDEQTLVRGILQSRVRDEWIPTLEKLAFEPLSVADAVNAVVQNHISQADGNRYATENGLQAGDFDILVETAGEPLSRTEMEELYNRGVVTEDQVKQALRESRVKNKYVDLAFQLHRRILPLRTIDSALRYGGLSHQDAIKIVMEQGYTESDANTVIAAGSGQKLQSHKNKVISSAVSLYEDNVITSDQALKIIEGMDATADEAKFILESAEFTRNAHLINAAVSAVKSKYLGHHIKRNQVISDLDALGIPASQRDRLIQVWDIEYGAYSRTLTEAQIVKAVKIKLISPEDGLNRLMDMGYNLVDAGLLLEGA